MFRLFALFLEFIFVLAVWIIAAIFAYQNIWLFVVMCFSLIVAFLLFAWFLIVKLKTESGKKVARYEMQIFEERYGELVRENARETARISQMRTKAIEAIELTDMIEEVTEERRLDMLGITEEKEDNIIEEDQ